MTQRDVSCSENILDIEHIQFVDIVSQQRYHVVAKPVEKDMLVYILWALRYEFVCVEHCSEGFPELWQTLLVEAQVQGYRGNIGLERYVLRGVLLNLGLAKLPLHFFDLLPNGP
jgi:hypothetical protein